MKIFADYHTHTVYSHGKGTIRENVEQAREIGLKKIAITDHGPNHIGFGVKKKNFKKMRQEIDKLNEEFKDIEVLLGVEANIINYKGKIDVSDEIINMLDILLVGFHFGAMPYSITDAYKMFGMNFIGRVSKSVARKIRDLNTEALIKAINRYNIFFITHPGAKVDIDSRKLARAAAKRGTALEINASHGQLTLEYLKIAMEEDVKFVISSDAHRPGDVGNVKSAIQKAQKANLSFERIINAEE